MAETLTTAEKAELRKQFDAIDLDHNGQITAEEVSIALGKLGETSSLVKVKALIEDVDTDKDGQVSFEEYCTLMQRMKRDDRASGSAFATVVKKTAGLNVVAGATDSTQHAFSDEEKMAFAVSLLDLFPLSRF